MRAYFYHWQHPGDGCFIWDETTTLHSNGRCFGDTCVLRAEPGDEKIAKNLKRNLHNGTVSGTKGQRLLKPGGPGNSSKVIIIPRDNITESFLNVNFLSFCLLVQRSYFALSALWVGDCPAQTAIRRSRCRALTYISAGSQGGGWFEMVGMAGTSRRWRQCGSPGPR